MNKSVGLRKKLGVAFLLWAICMSYGSVAQNIYTIAGNGTTGSSGDGGNATAAQLYYPFDVAVDAGGNLYISDQANSLIRKVSTTGIISTFAGTGAASFGGNGGPATAAQIDFPQGLAIDATGNMYIADGDNDYIRKINTSGVISSIAGNGSGGNTGDGGQATAAELSFPTGVAVDGSGNIYIADKENNSIRRVNASGIISTMAGTGVAGYSGDGGAATAAKLNNPSGVVVDAAGNVYIGDKINNRVRKVTPSGNITTIAGNGTAAFGGDSGPATAAQLSSPEGLAIDATGNIYVADAGNNRIRKITSGGIISTIAGSGTAGAGGDAGPATDAQLNGPSGVAIDGPGNIYIADQINNRIRIIPRPGSGIKGLSNVASSFVQVIPNPSNGSFTVHLESDAKEKTTVIITDVAGKIVKECMMSSTGEISVQINVPSGSYFVSAISNVGILTQKIEVY